VGYTGGDVKFASYRNHGTHAEGIEVIFDPAKMSAIVQLSGVLFPDPRPDHAEPARQRPWQPPIALASTTRE
jgi:peptide methionine sulfoxide reductase MsrA